ncbi:hypothetical protein HK405_004528 [Cladochytrium tenue]|nr:hypothetical protein HK405_004528 [Cladochytrium tenue]
MQGLDGWSAVRFRTILTAGAIWGAIGPARFFGPGSAYFAALLGFPLGLVLPFVPWALSRLHPASNWHLVNVPLLFLFPATAGQLRSDLLTPLAVALAVNVGLRRARPQWWARYAFVASAGLDVGSAAALAVIFLAIVQPTGSGFTRFYALNRYDLESCVPDYLNTCMEHMIVAGSTYNASQDIPVCQTFGLQT